MDKFEPILVGLLAVLVLLLFWPGTKEAIRRSREVENPDWSGALFPIALVLLFVIFLLLITGN